MISTSDELLDLLVSYGIAAKTYSHAAVHTVAESKDLRGEIAGLHTKNLFLKDKKRNFYLIVTEENTKIDLLSLGPKVDANGKLSFASPDALNEILGVSPGAVSLLAAVNDVEKRVAIVIDEALLKSNQINCHPLTNTRTTSLSKSDIATFLSATGHDPRYISMS